MQVRITDPYIVNKLRRLAFDRRSSIPIEVSRLLLETLKVTKKRTK